MRLPSHSSSDCPTLFARHSRHVPRLPCCPLSRRAPLGLHGPRSPAARQCCRTRLRSARRLEGRDASGQPAGGAASTELSSLVRCARGWLPARGAPSATSSPGLCSPNTWRKCQSSAGAAAAAVSAVSCPCMSVANSALSRQLLLDWHRPGAPAPVLAGQERQPRGEGAVWAQRTMSQSAAPSQQRGDDTRPWALPAVSGGTRKCRKC